MYLAKWILFHLQVKELIINKDPNLLDSFLDVSSNTFVSCLYPVYPLNVCVLSAGGDSIPTRPFVRCSQVCDWLHGRCMVSARAIFLFCNILVLSFPPVPWFPIHISLPFSCLHYLLVPIPPSTSSSSLTHPLCASFSFLSLPVPPSTCVPQ